MAKKNIASKILVFPLPFSPKIQFIFGLKLITEDELLTSYSVRLSQSKSEWFWNGKLVKKKLPIDIVFVNPFDSYSFHNQASFRRQWVDQHLSKIDKDYKKLLSDYNTSLKFRNKLLSKKPPKYWEQIKAIEPSFINSSIKIIEKRKKFLSEIVPLITKYFSLIFSEEHELELYVESKFAGWRYEDIQTYFTERRQKEDAMGFTCHGIHKDDFIFSFDGLNAFEFCSLGQQKMSFLSLLFAYVELFRYKFRVFPIVLLDDVSGELDRIRWQKLVRFLSESKFQVLITTANEKFREELEKINNANKLCVNAGSIYTV